MPSRRELIAMTPHEKEAYLHEFGHVMTLASIARTGVPHLVALYYGFFADGRIGVLTYAKSQKVRNLERDGRFSALVESGASYGELRGVHLTGTVELSYDPELKRVLLESISSRYPQGPAGDRAPTPNQLLALRVAILLGVENEHSWDHRKLGGSY